MIIATVFTVAVSTTVTAITAVSTIATVAIAVSITCVGRTKQKKLRISWNHGIGEVIITVLHHLISGRVAHELLTIAVTTVIVVVFAIAAMSVPVMSPISVPTISVTAIPMSPIPVATVALVPDVFDLKWLMMIMIVVRCDTLNKYYNQNRE